jgi:hypothetical protein
VKHLSFLSSPLVFSLPTSSPPFCDSFSRSVSFLTSLHSYLDPQKCVLGGGLYWATVAVPELGTNTYFHIQHHQFQPEAGVFHSLVSSYRKIVKNDEHSDMTYRIISIRAPYYIIACAKTLPEIISDWSFLER